MAREARPCARCEGTRFLHARHVVDARTVTREVPQLQWAPRPVGASPAGEPVGRFETFTCRSCGLTTWTAHDWTELTGLSEQRACRTCRGPTRHVRLPAIEHGANRLEPAPFLHNDGGLEGLLFVSICTSCDQVTWTAEQVDHLARARVDAEDELGRCIACRGVDVVVVSRARERGGVDIPLTVARNATVFGLITVLKSIGAFSLRACVACRVVAWSVKRPASIKPMPEHGLVEIEVDAPLTTPSGPYR